MLDGIVAVIEIFAGVCDAASAFADRGAYRRRSEIERTRGDALAACMMGMISLGFGAFTYTQYPLVGVAQIIIGGLLIAVGLAAIGKWRRLRQNRRQIESRRSINSPSIP